MSRRPEIAERPSPIERARVIAGSLPRELEFLTARRQADRALARLARGSRPIVAGPWLGEVGFELLYWIPMLRWLRERYGIERERLIVVSRGGADPWYEGLAGRYLDALDYVSPAELKTWIGEPGAQKPRRLGAFELELLRGMEPELGARPRVLHPGLLYGLFRRAWAIARSRPLAEILDRLRFAPLPAADPAGPGSAPLEQLPDEYVTVKAYFSPVFLDTRENRDFVQRLIASLAERTNVVLLSTGIEIDDHVDAARGLPGEVLDLRELVTPRDNLAVQTRAVRNSRALFATYGGFSYLGPLVGTHSFNFTSNQDDNPIHYEVANRMLRELASAGCSAACVRLGAGDLEHLSAILDGAVPSPA